MKFFTYLLLAATLGFFSCDQLKQAGGSFNTAFKVVSISPLEGEPGTHIRVHGTGFSKDSLQNGVLVNGVKAVLVFSSDTTLEAVIPETYGSNAQIRVQVKKVPSQNSFEYQYDDVYVFGGLGGTLNGVAASSIARVWKNGKSLKIADDTAQDKSSQAFAVEKGILFIGAKGGYYRNSVFVPLADETIVSDIKVHNNSVYVTASQGYYQDGVLTTLLAKSQQKNSINSISFDGDSMYVAGGESYNRGAVEFKNGRLVSFSPNDFHGSASFITVNDHKAYVAGQLFGGYSYEWVDGIGTMFPGGYGVFDIAFKGSVEYDLTFGPIGNNFFVRNKANALTPLNFPHFQPENLMGTTDALYVAGSILNGANSDAAYYRNNMLVKLPKSNYSSAWASKILVVKR